MPDLLKLAGFVVAGTGLSYGALAYVDYSKQDTVVRQFESRIRSWGADLKGMEDEVAKQTDLIASITKDSESDQQAVQRLQSELKGKQQELQAVERRLADASDVWGAKVQKATDARKAINDLRAKITEHSGKRKTWEEDMEAAKQMRQKVAEKWNPLTSPKVRELFGK